MSAAVDWPSTPEIVSELRRLFRYDAETGHFWWREPGRARQMGRPVGSRSKDRGYIEIKILGRRILAHRAAWAYVYGELPDQIDHRDLDTSNNRLTNLRPATTSLNAANRRGRNRFGIKGVDLALRNKLRPYRAQIKVSGRSLHLGYYATPGEAGAAYLSAAEKHFGEFARGGAN